MSSDAFTPALQSRLPKVGTTIFTVMSALATEHKAVNLGQGFPDFACDPALVDQVTAAMQAGHNQYPPMPGVPVLRQAVASKIASLHGRTYNADSEITITAGATQAIITAILAVVHPGDEVIVLEPCYDSYVPNIELAGGVVVRVPLTPGSFRPDFAKIAAAITPKTRALLINTPHNPSATIWSQADMLALQDLLAPTNVLLISDEVYEHMVFDNQAHESVSRYPGLAARAFVVSSFGKTFHVTGWKIGTVAAPAALMAEFRKVHQFNVFTVNTPVQHALAAYLANPAPYLELPAFYQRKRDLFRTGLSKTKFKLLPSQGSYFQCVDISEVSDLGESDFCQWLTREVGVAAIPLSAFYGDGFDQRVVRFCFAKQDATLLSALDRLAKL
jgi:methionine transaminase